MSQCACAEINATSEDSEDRVGIIADVSPDCGCEQHKMSGHSPGPVSAEETIVRMVCVPMHVHRKKAELLPNFFGHAFTRGMSAQRLEAATDDELADWVNTFLASKEDRAWLGYVEAPCSEIRATRDVADASKRGFCVYDAALAENPAHIEIASARRIPEADRVEARAMLWKVFTNGQVIPRQSLRSGAIVAKVSEELLARALPQQWQPASGGEAKG